jgi:hypothetical protein
MPVQEGRLVNNRKAHSKRRVPSPILLVLLTNEKIIGGTT